MYSLCRLFNLGETRIILKKKPTTKHWQHSYNNNNNNDKITSLAPNSSENQSLVAQQSQRIRHSRDHGQCVNSSTGGWTCQEAKEDMQD